MPNCVRRMRWKGYASLQRFRQCGRCAPAVLHSIKYLRSRGARGGRPLVRNQAIFLPFRQKDSPLLQHRNKGLSCRVRFHHPNLLLFSFPAVCRGFALHADSDRCEGKCSFKIPHHCVPTPESQNPVCFRTIQYIGLTSVDSAEPVF